MKRAALLLAVALPACAADQADPKSPAKDQSKAEQQKIAAVGYFDLGTLAVSPPAIPARVNKEVLTGVEVLVRPYVMECLVDPRNRGADKQTTVVVDGSLVDAGVEHKITGQNLTPAGTACIDGALKRWTAAIPGLNARAASGPVQSHVEFQHLVGTSPAVTLGLNDASDLAAGVRLAVPGWGDCFAEWKAAAPRALQVSIKVTRPAGTPPAQVSPADAIFEAAGDAAADKVAACLKTKLLALKVKTPATESLTVPFTFRFVHSGVADALPVAAPEVQFAQLDLTRGRRAAEVAISLGDRMVAVGSYDGAVKGYKEKAKPEVTVKELKEKCAALLAADDKVIEALRRQHAVEETTHRFATEQRAKDPSWADAEAAAAQKVALAQKDVDGFVGFRKQDEAACPKER